MHGTFKTIDQVGQLLLEGADLIEKHGHTKGKLHDHEGRMCFMGALYAAKGEGIYAGWSEYHHQAAGRVALHLGLDPVLCAVTQVVEWNNAPERTGREVIDAMRAAARA